MEGVFIYSIPTRIVYGCHAALSLKEEVLRLGITRALLVTDSGLEKTGISQMIQGELEKGGIAFQVFSGLETEPTLGTINEGLLHSREGGCDGIIGLGGGSPLDTAKAIAMLHPNSGALQDFVGKDALPIPPLPFIAIPTTSGTGSEATRWSLILDEEAGVKLAIGCWESMPDTAICDPLLTLTKPPALTAACGLDALTHAIEALISTSSQDISQAMALKSIALIGKNLRQAVFNGQDIQARDGMMMGSLTAALAFNVTGVNTVHAISHVVGARCRVPHGVANALLLPHVMEYSLPGALDGFALIHRALGGIPSQDPMEEAWAAVTGIQSLLMDIGLNKGLLEYGLKEEEIPNLAQESALHPMHLLNPQPMDMATIHTILQQACYPVKNMKLQA